MRHLFLILTLTISNNALAKNSTAVTTLLKQYQLETTVKFSATAGNQLWLKKYKSQSTGETRSCTTCHTKNITVTGKHIKTKKPIEPLAPSVNDMRLTKTKNIKKWFKRNCKWTLGRECTAEEKGHLLMYIQSQ